MLQQTQVNTVIPYFNRFMELFPNVVALESASSETVLKAWEGLGYYLRARNLHEAAKMIVENFSGQFPKDYESIIKLKGIGSYTAGAISSIAYNEPVPAVDGNVMRVMSRILTIWDDVALTKTKIKFEDIINDIIPIETPSNFNQGLMELGALICKPKGQKCSICPVMKHCIAYNGGVDDQLPFKSSKTKQVNVPLITGIIINNRNQYLMRKRPDQGLLANMWEFVQVEGFEFEDLKFYLLEHYNIELEKGFRLGEVKHIFTHRIWLMNVYKSSVSTFIELPNHLKWLSKEELELIPISTAHRKLFEWI
jgi:A/G-specific adenine glycosylase